MAEVLLSTEEQDKEPLGRHSVYSSDPSGGKVFPLSNFALMISLQDQPLKTPRLRTECILPARLGSVSHAPEGHLTNCPQKKKKSLSSSIPETLAGEYKTTQDRDQPVSLRFCSRGACHGCSLLMASNETSDPAKSKKPSPLL